VTGAVLGQFFCAGPVAEHRTFTVVLEHSRVDPKHIFVLDILGSSNVYIFAALLSSVCSHG
jgi:hypothetical protein